MNSTTAMNWLLLVAFIVAMAVCGRQRGTIIGLRTGPALEDEVLKKQDKRINTLLKINAAQKRVIGAQKGLIDALRDSKNLRQTLAAEGGDRD